MVLMTYYIIMLFLSYFNKNSQAVSNLQIHFLLLFTSIFTCQNSLFFPDIVATVLLFKTLTDYYLNVKHHNKNVQKPLYWQIAYILQYVRPTHQYIS